jgi:hydroxymethylpyrimidine pyrophosphatase-like HAD family hydrolase
MTGDGENDLTMLRNVHCGGGEGVAMGNGMEQVKLAAVI